MTAAKPKAHIMVIDDLASMRDLVKDFLESQGYLVSCYSSVPVALRSLREGGLPDAVVSDIRMGPLDGMDLLRLIRDENPVIPVLLFTAFGSPEEKAESMKMGAAHYLTKPFELAVLKSSLERALSTVPAPAAPRTKK